MGGALILSSRVGEGVVAQIWLPASGEAVARPYPSPQGVAVEGMQGTALLVDDEDLPRASTAEMLKELGYQVVEVCSSLDALALFDSGSSFDLLLTDHLMPGMTGADLVRTLRRTYPQLRALIVSGYADVDAIAPDLPRLMKPFRHTDLADSLAALGSARVA